MSGESVEARLARLEERDRAAAAVRADRDREIRDIKRTVEDVDAKVDQLLADKNQRHGAATTAKWFIGFGFFGIVGSIIVATLQYVGLLRPHG